MGNGGIAVEIMALPEASRQPVAYDWTIGLIDITLTIAGGSGYHQ